MLSESAADTAIDVDAQDEGSDDLQGQGSVPDGGALPQGMGPPPNHHDASMPMPPPPPRDAGGGAPDGSLDGGAPAQDAGEPAQDAGEQDAGDPSQDAGDQDAGEPVQDAGEQDGGEQDAGEQDAGDPPPDPVLQSVGGGCGLDQHCAPVGPNQVQQCVLQYNGDPVPGGYCSGRCSQGSQCGEGGRCVEGQCVRGCESDDDCPRGGYFCRKFVFQPKFCWL